VSNIRANIVDDTSHGRQVYVYIRKWHAANRPTSTALSAITSRTSKAISRDIYSASTKWTCINISAAYFLLSVIIVLKTRVLLLTEWKKYYKTKSGSVSVCQQVLHGNVTVTSSKRKAVSGKYRIRRWRVKICTNPILIVGQSCPSTQSENKIYLLQGLL